MLEHAVVGQNLLASKSRGVPARPLDTATGREFAAWPRDQNEIVAFRGFFISARDRACECELVATHYFVFSM